MSYLMSSWYEYIQMLLPVKNTNLRILDTKIAACQQQFIYGVIKSY